MESRGIQKIGTITTTSALRGVIKDKAEVRAEFMSFVSNSSQGVRGV
jgi:GTP cyclohydrolase I